MLDNNKLAPAILKLVDFKELNYSVPTLHFNIASLHSEQYNITVSTDTYAHAVEITLPDGAVADDNYFDLLPNQKHTVSVKSPQPLSKRNVSVEPYSLTGSRDKLKASLKLPIETAGKKSGVTPNRSGVL
jgi:hypothetical protein